MAGGGGEGVRFVSFRSFFFLPLPRIRNFSAPFFRPPFFATLCKNFNKSVTKYVCVCVYVCVASRWNVES